MRTLTSRKHDLVRYDDRNKMWIFKDIKYHDFVITPEAKFVDAKTGLVLFLKRDGRKESSKRMIG